MMLRTFAATCLLVGATTAAVGSLRVATNASPKMATVEPERTGDDDLRARRELARAGDTDARTVGSETLEAAALKKWRPSARKLVQQLQEEGFPEKLVADGLGVNGGTAHRTAQVRQPLLQKKTTFTSVPLGKDADGGYLGTGRLTIKFNNDIGARASMFGGMPVISTRGFDVSPLNEILDASGATVTQAIKMPEAKIQEARRIAFERSNRIQPDFSAIMKIEFPGDTPNWPVILETAQAINAMDNIEYVSFERLKELHSPQEDCDTPPANKCNRPRTGVANNCWDGVGPAPIGGTNCNDDMNCPANGGMDDTFCVVGCDDPLGCCGRVADFPFTAYCNEIESPQGWDALCAAVANQQCIGNVYQLDAPPITVIPAADRYDPCLSNYNPDPLVPGTTNNPAEAVRATVFETVANALLESCYEPTGVPRLGCSNASCCAFICANLDVTCCTEDWDQVCVDLANDSSIGACIRGFAPVGAPSPELTATQAYRTSESWLTQFPTGTGDWVPTIADPQAGQVPGNDYDKYFSFTAGNAGADPATDPPYLGYSGEGLDVSGAMELAGIMWRIYGSGAISPSLPSPEIVWLEGAEFEIVPSGECTSDDCIPFKGSWTPPNAGNPFGAFAPAPNTPADPNPFADFCVDTSFNYLTIAAKPTGRRQQIAVCEFGAWVNHEEFSLALKNPLQNTNFPADYTTAPDWATVRTEEGVTQLLVDTQAGNHGIACLGVIAGRDNGFGVTGIAPRAEAWFFPIQSVEEGDRTESAFINMLLELDAGVVINHSWGFVVPCDGDQISLASEPAYGSLIAAQNDAGFVICQSAGNNRGQMSDAEAAAATGLIIVGAVQPGRDLSLDPTPSFTACGPFQCQYTAESFTNYFTDDGSGVVHLSAWGSCGTTLGYGSVYRGVDNRPPSLGDLTFIERQATRAYCGPAPGSGRGLFNGTSFACPQVTGGLALVQCAARMWWNTPLNSTLMKVANVGIGPNDPVIQCGNSSGCPLLAPGDCVEPCFSSIPTTPGCEDCPAIESYCVGKFMDIQGGMVGALTSVTKEIAGGITVYTGTLKSGGPLSLSNQDGARLVIESEFANSGVGPAGIPYYGTGQTTDFGATLKSRELSETDLSLVALASAAATDSSFTLEIPFAENLITNRYEFIGSRLLTNVQGPANLFPLNVFGPASRFFTDDFRINVRMYTVSLGFNGGVTRVRWDQVSIVTLLGGPVDP